MHCWVCRPPGCHLLLTGPVLPPPRETLDFPRSWLLPVIRDHVRETRLGFFTTYFLPLATTLKGKGMGVHHSPAAQPEGIGKGSWSSARVLGHSAASLCQTGGQPVLESLSGAVPPSACGRRTLASSPTKKVIMHAHSNLHVCRDVPSKNAIMTPHRSVGFSEARHGKPTGEHSVAATEKEALRGRIRERGS